jgi:uncharacterized protein with ParB-like and HNH nuclease domain
MSFQTPINIADAIDNISRERYLLPAIQREFEWGSEKIEWLFDSLMRGYPISSFLFWNVEGKTVSDYRFYKFLRVYREHFQIHNESANLAGSDNFTAVLDGQQRLTSLYVGLKGSYAYKEPRRHKKDDEWSIPTRHLYLNIAKTLKPKDEETGRKFEFAFLKKGDTGEEDLHGGKQWFRVGKILDLRNTSALLDYLRTEELPDISTNILSRLHEVVFTERSINYFLEKEQDLDKALNIFIRINSGGEPLGFSDLIMSIAIASWQKKNAREEIHALVDRVGARGFTINKDFIFKTFLFLYSGDIRFKVTNFTTDNARQFEKEWEAIRDAIAETFELIGSFGFDDHTLTSKNAVIPIIYYLYHRGIYRGVKTRKAHEEDRGIMAKWLLVMTLKKVFGGQSDGTLAQIRHAFTADVTSANKIPADMELFPAEAINTKIRRDTSIGQDFVEELLGTQKDDRYAFSILALLNPHLDYRNDFHKDHLHPISAFEAKKLDKLNLSPEDRAFFEDPEWNNSIVNLQMLDANENMSKQDKALTEWVDEEARTKGREAFLNRCQIPLDASLEFKDFREFAEKRNDLLIEKLLELLK